MKTKSEDETFALLEKRKACLQNCGYDKMMTCEIDMDNRTPLSALLAAIKQSLREMKFSHHEHPTVTEHKITWSTYDTK